MLQVLTSRKREPVQLTGIGDDCFQLISVNSVLSVHITSSNSRFTTKKSLENKM